MTTLPALDPPTNLADHEALVDIAIAIEAAGSVAISEDMTANEIDFFPHTHFGEWDLLRRKRGEEC